MPLAHWINPRTFIACGALAGAAALGVWMGGRVLPPVSTASPSAASPLPASSVSTAPANHYQPPVSASQRENSPEPPTAGYFLRAFDGKIGVFVGQNPEPDFLLDVSVKYLPEYDQEQLAKGVYAENYDILMTLMEDYNS